MKNPSCGHVQLQRIWDQSAVMDLSCWSPTVTVVSGHGRFCSSYNYDDWPLHRHCILILIGCCSQWQAGWQWSLAIWKSISLFRKPLGRHIDILDYVNGIGNGCMFAQSTPPLLVGMETSILTMPIYFSVNHPREIGAMAAGLPRCKLIPATRTTV